MNAITLWIIRARMSALAISFSRLFRNFKRFERSRGFFYPHFVFYATAHFTVCKFYSIAMLFRGKPIVSCNHARACISERITLKHKVLVWFSDNIIQLVFALVMNGNPKRTKNISTENFQRNVDSSSWAIAIANKRHW